MLPEWEKPQQRQRGLRKANVNKEHISRKPRDENLKDQSFHYNLQSNGPEKGFLPEIGNARQKDVLKPRGYSLSEKKTLQRQYPTPLDRNSGTEDKNNTPLVNRKHNNSVEPPAARKYFEDMPANNVKAEDPQEENNNTPNKIPKNSPNEIPNDNENYKTLRVPMRIEGQEPLNKTINTIHLNDMRATKRAYGQYLLDQMKANEDKKTLERRMKWEEDKELLSQKNFFDGSRDNLRHKYRNKIGERKRLIDPINFDKIHNRHINYNLYSQSNLHNNDHSFSHPVNVPIRSVKNQKSERENFLVNQTIQPHYHNDICDPHERKESFNEESPGMIFDNSENRENKLLEHFETGDGERRDEHGLKIRDTQKLLSQRKAMEKPLPILELQPSADRLAIDSEALKNYIAKLEYKKELDQQVLEKQLQRAHEEKLRQMADKIEELQLSKQKMKKELDEKSHAINMTLLRRNQQAFQDEHYSQSRHPVSNLRLHGNNLGGGGGGSGGIIVLQPGDATSKGKSMMYNYSSKKNLEHKLSARRELQDSRRELHESPSRSELSPQLEDQVQSEFNRLRDELRENNKRVQDQLSDVKNFLKRPVLRESDSRRSLANDSKLVPIVDPIPGQVVKAGFVVPINYLIKESELPHHLDSYPRIIQHNDLSVRSPARQDSTEAPHYHHNIDKEALYDHLNLVVDLEKCVKFQNIELRKELQDMKVKLYKLLGGEGTVKDYNQIHFRLKELQEEQNVPPPTQIISTLRSDEAKIKIEPKSIYYITPGRRYESKTTESITFLSKSVLDPGDELGIRRSNRIERNVNQTMRYNNESKSVEPRRFDLSELTELTDMIAEVPSSQATNTTKCLVYPKKEPIQPPTQIKQIQSQPKQLRLKKTTRGQKRVVRFGEEEISKRL